MNSPSPLLQPCLGANTSNYFFGVLDQQGTPSQYSEQGQNITAYGVVYKKTFSVKLNVPYSTTQHALLYRVIATLCYSVNRDEIPACGQELGRNFSYEIFPENENTLQVRCIINVLSSQHNKSHFRIRFQLADTRTNELLLEYTTWTNPIWVVSKSKLTAGGSNRHSTTRKVRSTPPAATSTTASMTTHSNNLSSTPLLMEPLSPQPLSTSSDMITIMDLLTRVLKGQDQQQDQLNTLIRHQTVQQSCLPEDHNLSAALSQKRSYDDIEEDLDNAFRHIKKPRHAEDTEILKKIADKYQEEIRMLYELLPEECGCPAAGLNATAVEPCSVSTPNSPLHMVSSPPLPNQNNNNNNNSSSVPPVTGIDFPDVEFFPQLDEFVWTE